MTTQGVATYIETLKSVEGIIFPVIRTGGSRCRRC